MSEAGSIAERPLVIVGVGLIGASLGLALKSAGYRGEIVGYSRSRQTLDTALQRGVVDRAEADLATAVQGAGVVVMTTPMLAMPTLMAALSEQIERDTIVTDGGSVKATFAVAAREYFPDSLDRIVPGHPIAGREHSGVEAGDASLFRDHRVILTPLLETSPDATARVRALWQRCGSDVLELDLESHDALLAASSHLPHYAAFALVDMLAARPEKADIFRFAAGGFRDFTRVASSDPVMWRDIALCNTEAIVSELDAYAAALTRLRTLVANGDADALEAIFSNARDTRNAWLSELEDPTP